MSPRHQDDELRRRLRAGDPADDGREPDRAELLRWRRRMLDAAAERQRPALRPIWLAPLAAAALAATLLLTLPWRPAPPPEARPGNAPPSAPDAGRRDGMPAPAEMTAADATTPSQGFSRQATAALPEAMAQPLPAKTTAGPAAAAATPAVARRSVQFTAPGGTRIFWTLDPRLDLKSQGGAS